MTNPDHEAITRKVYEYAYGIDTRDWASYRAIFDDRIDVDFSSYHGGAPATMSTDDWLAGVKPLFTGLDATQHSMSNPLVDIDETDGDAARCRMYMQAAHFLEDWPTPEFTIGGYYDDRLVRTDNGWRITAVTLTVWWRRGDSQLMVEARERGLRRLEVVS
jgi:3-phenylpropionate/cinnamic acid dioxygenase small subunit